MIARHMFTSETEGTTVKELGPDWNWIRRRPPVEEPEVLTVTITKPKPVSC